jgi:hypothetical protein
MAKRVPPEEKPYRPVDAALVGNVLAGPPPRPTVVPQAPAEREVSAPAHDLRPLLTRRRPTGDESAGTTEGNPTDRVPKLVGSSRVERLSRMKRILLTPSEDRELERVVQTIGDELQTSLKFSHVMRACMSILRHAEQEIAIQAHRASPLRRPPNEDPIALAEFEHRLSQLLLAGLKAAPPIRQ